MISLTRSIQANEGEALRHLALGGAGLGGSRHSRCAPISTPGADARRQRAAPADIDGVERLAFAGVLLFEHRDEADLPKIQSGALYHKRKKGKRVRNSTSDFSLHSTLIDDWLSDEPHLSGNFAPVGPEINAADLPVVAGRILEGLSGAYLRNGSNPLFKPISYTYPFDGDGMIHAVYLDGGRARYRNRLVETRGLKVERRAGRAVDGGIMRPVPVDPALVARMANRGQSRAGRSSMSSAMPAGCWRWARRTPVTR